MEKIVQLLESKGIRPTAMRLMTYKRLAELEVAISLGDLEKDFKVSEEFIFLYFEWCQGLCIVIGQPYPKQLKMPLHY